MAIFLWPFLFVGDKMKTFIEFLNEDININKPLIVVDIQPEYQRFCKKLITKKFIDIINNQKNIIWFWNGEDYTNDTKEKLINWLNDFDIDTDHIIFIEKGYGFFRDWMDMGIDSSTIISVIREMVLKKVTNSDDLDPEYIDKITDGATHISNIYLPNISISMLKKLSGAYICGGGKNECLWEIELLMNAFNIKYTELKDFIYEG
ncbi:MAG: hypothetical protein PHC28_16295 [Flavobacterium sp.]|uniref:hypothetical protein n=1 Tax=Flavobacterium sp. TaxID=239 RepID=UPI0026172AE2|nr:hypothetical protein [Flavobacterium sp.]MDD5152014.1 hypothetical protein [Flavobacterium sp.]